MICPNCGHEIPDGIKFCPKCGTNLILSAGAAAKGEDEKPVKIVPLEKLPPAPTRSVETEDSSNAAESLNSPVPTDNKEKTASISQKNESLKPKYIYYSKDTDLIIPAAFRPMSVLSTAGYLLLFMVPVVGWITAIVFSFDNTSLHRRNLSRSFVIASVLFALLMVLVYAIAPALPWPRVILS